MINSTTGLIARAFREPTYGLALWRLVIAAAAIATVWLWQKPTGVTSTVLAGLWLTTLVWSLLVISAAKLRRDRLALTRELIIDIIWVSVLIYFSARTTNPFIYYFLVITALAALLLPIWRAWIMCTTTIGIYTAFLWVDNSLHFEHFSSDYRWHMIGMWINYVGSSALICFFITQLMRAIGEQQQHIEHIREDNLKQEQLIALATVSATTVHELATPLSTLTILTDEMAASLPDHQADDIALLKSQIKRCQTTIDGLTQVAHNGLEPEPCRVTDLLADLTHYFSLHQPDNPLAIVNNLSGDNLQVLINQLFRYGLINIINNAAQYTQSSAKISISQRSQQLIIGIENTADHTKVEQIAQWGSPVTEGYSGVGIGSFLANSTIEQLGGTVSVSHCKHTLKPDLITVLVEVAMPIYTNS